MADGKKRSTLAVLRRVGGYISEDRRLAYASVIALVAGSFALAIAPSMAGDAIDMLSEYVASGYTGLDVSAFVGLLLVIAALYVFGNGATMFSNRNMVVVSRNAAKKMRRNLHNKLNRVPISFLDSHSSGDISSRLTNDLTTAETLLETDLLTLVVQVLLIVLILIMMLVVNPVLALVYVVLMPVSFVTIRFITGRTKRGFRLQQSTVGELNGYMGDVIGNHLLVKSYNMESASEERFEEINKRFHKAYVKSKFASGFILPVTLMINNIGYICVSIFGAYMILQGDLTLGGFTAFLLYGQMLSSPLQSASSSMNQVQSGLAAAERLFDILDAEEEPDENGLRGLDVSKVRGRVAFDDVTFGYTPDRTLFEHVSFEVEPGTVTAIVGPSGAGKTTIINLLMRFYEVNGGRILLDGEDTREINRDELRKAFGMVLQDSWVFDGTVAENISYGKEGATREDVVKAAETVGCDTFIHVMPDGYDTYISEENSQLSVGEKQLLVLARAVLADPKILILDEATSNMDTRTEAMVTHAMESMMEGRTTFVIAHRLFTIRNADKIIFMKDGDIKEVGSHEELMDLDGLYAEMYRSLSSV